MILLHKSSTDETPAWCGDAYKHMSSCLVCHSVSVVNALMCLLYSGHFVGVVQLKTDAIGSNDKPEGRVQASCDSQMPLAVCVLLPA